MFRRLILGFAAIFLLVLGSGAAQAQSGCPYIAPGAILTAAQWQACWSAKIDYQNGAITVTSINSAAYLLNGVPAATTVNGTSCVLGGSCSITETAASVSVGVTTIVGGTSGQILYQNGASPSGTIGELPVTGTAGSVVLSGSPTLASPTFTGTATMPDSATWTSGGIVSTTINNSSVGATTAAAGSFTTLAASSTVSGTGFSNYLASPPIIGGVAPASGFFLALSVTPGTLAGGSHAFTLTTTQPAVTVSQQNAVSLAVTGAGSASQINTALNVVYNSGYTGSSLNIAAAATNDNAGTGNTLIPEGGNLAAVGNIGLYGTVTNSAALDIGVVGQANNSNSSGTSVGVLGLAQNTSGPHQIGVAGSALSFSYGIGGWFTLNGSLPNLSAALVADSATNGNAIAYFLAGGTVQITMQISGGLSVGTSAVDPGAGGIEATLVDLRSLTASFTNTLTSGTTSLVNLTPTLTPGGSSSQVFNSIAATPTLTGSQNMTASLRGVSTIVTNGGTGTASTVRGYSASITNSSTGAITTGTNYNATANNTGGGTISSAIAYNVSVPVGPSTAVASTWTQIYGIDINDQNPTSSGGGSNTLTNPPVALRIESQTASGAFAIQQAGSGINSFAGVVDMTGLPTSNPGGAVSSVCWGAMAGGLWTDTSGTICGISALRFKDLAPEADWISPAAALAGIASLRTVVGRYKPQYQDHGASTHVWLIADDVSGMDERCAVHDDPDAPGAVTNYSDRCVEAYLVGAIKELKADNDGLRRELRAAGR